jgi:hypothetical protein
MCSTECPSWARWCASTARGRYDIEPDALVEVRTGRPAEQPRFARPQLDVGDTELFWENWGAIYKTMLSRGWKRRMTNPLSRIAIRVAYGASQLPRVAWYVGHGLAMRRLAEATRRQDGQAARPRPHTDAPLPDRRRLYADMAVLLRHDLANVEAGLYPSPPIMTDRC